MKFSPIKIYQLIREKEKKEKRKRMISWGEGLIWGVVAIIFISQAWSIFGPEEAPTNYAFTFLYEKSETPKEVINLDSIRNILDTIVESPIVETNHTERMTDFIAKANTPEANNDMLSFQPKEKPKVRKAMASSRGVDKEEMLARNQDSTNQENEAESIIEMKAPSFVGGMDALNQFIAQQLRYPESARENRIEGKVMLKLWIEVDGKIAQIGILESLGYGCDEEAVRIIQTMPSWVPGRKKGEKRGMWAHVPVIFSLNRAK